MQWRFSFHWWIFQHATFDYQKVIPDANHGAGIFTDIYHHLPQEWPSDVGKYSSTMEHPGMVSTCFNHGISSCASWEMGTRPGLENGRFQALGDVESICRNEKCGGVEISRQFLGPNLGFGFLKLT